MDMDPDYSGDKLNVALLERSDAMWAYIKAVRKAYGDDFDLVVQGMSEADTDFDFILRDSAEVEFAFCKLIAADAEPPG